MYYKLTHLELKLITKYLILIKKRKYHCLMVRGGGMAPAAAPPWLCEHFLPLELCVTAGHWRNSTASICHSRASLCSHRLIRWIHRIVRWSLTSLASQSATHSVIHSCHSTIRWAPGHEKQYWDSFAGMLRWSPNDLVNPISANSGTKTHPSFFPLSFSLTPVHFLAPTGLPSAIFHKCVSLLPSRLN